jgi:hypothetical protein
MMNNGFLKLSRRFFDHTFWSAKRKFSKAEAFLDLIASANFAPKKVMVGNSLIYIERGQQVASLRFLAERWGWSKNKVSSFLKLLENDQILGQQQTQGQTILTLCNYDTYNSNESLNGTPSGTKKGHERDTKGTKQKKVRTKEVNIRGFKKPTLDEIQAYGETLNPPFKDPQGFLDYYESNGWKVGRNPMKDWQATVRNWNRKNRPTQDQPKEGQVDPITNKVFAGGMWRKRG